MPRLPDAGSFATGQNPNATSAVVGLQGPNEGAMLAGAQETVRQGQAVGAFGEKLAAEQRQQEKEFEAKARIEQHRVDTLRAESQFTALREKELDLTYGDGGYTKVKGTDALGKPVLQDYRKRFGDQVKQMADGLGNDQQKQMFLARAGVAGVGYQEGILRHLAQEGKIAQAEEFKGRVEVETRIAIANYNDPMVVAFSVKRIEDGVDTMARANGWTPDYAQAVRQEKLGKLHDAVIDQMIAANQLVQAKDWYQANKADVDVSTAKSLEAKTYDAAQRQAFNGYQSTYLGVQDSLPGLKQLQSMVTKDGKLDDGRKNVLIGRIQSQMQGIERRNEAAADRQQRRAETELNAMVTRIGQGWEPTNEQLGGLITMARGRPQLEGLINQVVGTANATRAFRQADPVVQERMVTQATVAVREGKAEPKVLAVFKSIMEAQQTERNADPVTFSVRQQLVSPNDLAAKPIDTSNPAQMTPNQVQARMDLARTMAAQYRTPFKPLTEQERKLAVGSLANASAEQRKEYFRGLSLAAGSDYEGYKAVMAQIAPDDPVMANAGLFARRGYKDQQAGAAADHLIKGISILRPDRKTDGKGSGPLIPMPPSKEMDSAFTNYTRQAYSDSPDARNATFQSAQAIYASMTNDAGDRDTTVLDTRRWARAMEMATGGVIRHKGRQVVKPWGMPDGDFADGVHARMKSLEAAGALPERVRAGDLYDLPLRAAGDGRYFVMSGDARMKDKAGRPIVIDFNVPLPAALPTSTNANNLKAREAERQRQVKEARTVVKGGKSEP